MDIQKSATKVLEFMHGLVDFGELYPNIPKLWERLKNDFSSRRCGGGSRMVAGPSLEISLCKVACVAIRRLDWGRAHKPKVGTL